MGLKVGVVGCGQWGQNYLRVLSELDDTELCAACDLRAEVRERIAARYPGVRVLTRVEEILADDGLEAVVVATEARAHYEGVATAVRRGQQPLRVKPLALLVEDGVELGPLSA